jgi:hypothetical protein
MLFKDSVVKTRINLGYNKTEIEIAISYFLRTNPDSIKIFNKKLICLDKNEIEINLNIVIISLEAILKELNKTFN